MDPVRKYLDYRAYLHDYYRHRRGRDRYFSYRFMAQRVGMDHGYLVRLVQRKVHLAEGHVPRFLKLCGLKGREAEYFRTLVRFNRCQDPDGAALLFERLMELAGIQAHAVEKDQLEFYSAWYHSAIRALLGIMRHRGGPAQLAKALDPPLTEKQAQDSVLLLERLGLARRHDGGGHVPTDALLTAGGSLEAAGVRQFQREMLRLAVDALVRHPPEHRDMSTVTLAIASRDLEEIRGRLTALRHSVMNFAAMTAEPDTVFQLNLQLFPLSRMGRG